MEEHLISLGMIYELGGIYALSCFHESKDEESSNPPNPPPPTPTHLLSVQSQAGSDDTQFKAYRYLGF